MSDVFRHEDVSLRISIYSVWPSPLTSKHKTKNMIVSLVPKKRKVSKKISVLDAATWKLYYTFIKRNHFFFLHVSTKFYYWIKEIKFYCFSNHSKFHLPNLLQELAECPHYNHFSKFCLVLLQEDSKYICGKWHVSDRYYISDRYYAWNLNHWLGDQYNSQKPWNRFLDTSRSIRIYDGEKCL